MAASVPLPSVSASALALTTQSIAAQPDASLASGSEGHVLIVYLQLPGVHASLLNVPKWCPSCTCRAAAEPLTPIPRPAFASAAQPGAALARGIAIVAALRVYQCCKPAVY